MFGRPHYPLPPAAMESSFVVGLVGSVVAILGFGTQGVFVKSPTIREHDVHPFLVVALVSLSTALIGIFVGVGALVAEGFYWPPDNLNGLYASAAYAPGNILLLWYVSCLTGRGGGVWGGCVGGGGGWVGACGGGTAVCARRGTAAWVRGWAGGVRAWGGVGA